MTQRTRARIAALATAVFIALSGTAHAQAVRGTLLGTVHDAQGAAVPGATVTAVETQTNISRSAVTNQSGNYVFANMKDGRYRVETELTGFKKFSRDNVEVKVNSTVRVDVVLEVGNMEETVEVVQETPALETDRADTGRTIEGCQVQQMPARPQPQLPDAVGHRARDGDDDASALPVLQPAGQPGDEVQRPVAPFEQRPGGRARQQPQDGPAHRLHPFRRGDRLGQRQHVQLRRRVRPRRRLGDDGRAQVRHQPAQGQRLLLRQQRGHAGQELLRVGHGAEAGDEVPAVRRHARRTGHQGQALLLRRLPAHGRQPRRSCAGW